MKNANVEFYTAKRWPSPLMTSSIEVVGGVPQIDYKIPLDGSVSPFVADLDFGQVFDRLIVGPLNILVRYTELSLKLSKPRESRMQTSAYLFPAYRFAHSASYGQN
jgi:hypothetical protein